MLDIQSDERWCFALVIFARFVAVDGGAIAAAMLEFETRDLHQMLHVVCDIHDSYDSDRGRPRAYKPWGRSHNAEEYRRLQEWLVTKLVSLLDGYGHVSYEIPMLQELVGLREKDLGKNGFLCSRVNTRFCKFYNFQLSSFVPKLRVFVARTQSF